MTPLILSALSLDDVQLVRRWRAPLQMALRTPHFLTATQQEKFYHEVVCNPQAPHRYWAVREGHDHIMLAQVGLVDIQWTNGHGEISLIANPERTRQGVGREAVRLVLEEAFERMALRTVWGECYHSNPSLPFWELMVEVFRGTSTTWPRRKFWNGKLWDSLLFTFTAEQWNEPKGEMAC